MSNHLPAAWCDRCGLLWVPSEIVDGVCSYCRDDGADRTPPGPSDAEIDRAMARMDHLFGRDWFEAKR